MKHFNRTSTAISQLLNYKSLKICLFGVNEMGEEMNEKIYRINNGKVKNGRETCGGDSNFRSLLSQAQQTPKRSYSNWLHSDARKMGSYDMQLMARPSKSEELFSEDEISHGPSWLIGRHVKTAKVKNTGKDNYVQQLTSEIRKELAAVMEEKINKKVQENLRRVLKKLGEANTSFNLNVEELYTSDSDAENGTPVTTPTTTMEGTNGASS